MTGLFAPLRAIAEVLTIYITLTMPGLMQAGLFICS